jgi:hypothetical protein
MSRRYRRMLPSVYQSAAFRALSAPQPNGQTLLVYLKTGPESVSIPGVVAAGEAALAEALGWPLRAFRRVFRELEAADLARADWSARLVFLPAQVVETPPDNPNMVKAWRSAFDELPECPLRTEAFETVRTILETVGPEFLQPFTQPLRDRMANQKQKQKQDAEAGAETPPPSPSSPEGGAVVSMETSNGDEPAWGTPEALATLYNAETPAECPAVEKLSPARREKARRYLIAFPAREFWEQAFREIHASEFLRGRRRRDGHAAFVATFDWLLTRGKDGTENCLKVAEGQYRG